MRFRNVFIILGTIVTLMLLTLSDPDLGLVKNIGIGAGTITSLVYLFKGILGCTLLYVVRKAMADYKVADFEALGNQAVRTPEGAAQYAIANALMTIAYAIVIVGAFSV